MTPHFSPYVEAGDLVFLSGALAFGADGKIQGDVAEQTRRVLAHLADVLNDAGLALTDVVKTTVWITRAEDFPSFNVAYAEVFGSSKPARSTVVTELAVPGALVEIEAVAKRP